MLLGEPLFQGGGQLAVLLAIRDCRLDRLDALRDSVPSGLPDVSRARPRPDARYATAGAVDAPPSAAARGRGATRAAGACSPSDS